MENSDITNVVSQVRLETKVSAKGSKYTMLILRMDNGQEVELLLDRAWANYLALLKQTQKDSTIGTVE